METIYTPQSQFLGRFAKAIECIDIMALETVNTKFDKIGAQEYKWADIIIDKETRVAMDLKKFLKHPKYTET